MLKVSADIAARAAGQALSAAERARYSRHLLLPEVGPEGQARLKAAKILVLGAGGLGSPVALYLAAAGVGTLGLIEFDVVDQSNLQRQILYGEAQAGQPKLAAALSRLKELNSLITLIPHAERFSAENAERLLAPYDLLVDGTDNFATRYLASDACALLGKPYVYGSIFRFDGQASVFYPPHGPCYRCLFPAPPPPGQVPSCAEGGVLGVLPAQIGAVQATEALKLVLGIGEPLMGRLLTYDALTLRFDELRLPKDPACPLCGARPTIKTIAESAEACTMPTPPTTPQGLEITVDAYHQLREQKVPHTLLDVRNPPEVAVCRIDGSVVIPLGELPRRLSELPQDKPLVVHCKGGGRSLQAVELLREHGFADAASLKGGILAWIDRYAPELPKY